MRRLSVVLLMLAAAGCGGGGASSRGGDPIKAALQELSEGIYPRLPAGAKKTSLAIVGFSPVAGGDLANDPFSRYLVEELTLKLVNDGRVTVAERSQLDKVMKEIRLESSGAVSDASAKQLGALLGVDGVLLGTYMDLGREVKVNQRVIATESGEILAASTTNVPKTKVVKQLLKPKRSRR